MKGPLHDHRPLNPVAQLPHIPRPAVGLHGLTRLVSKAQHSVSPHFGQDIVGKQLDVLGPLAQAGVRSRTTLSR